MSRYEIQLVTSDCKNAGSDANFYMTLNGTAGSSVETKIDNSADNFERNHLDFFHIDTAAPLGVIQSVRIRHDNTGEKPGWHGRYVIVRDTASNQPYIARIDRWLAKSEGDQRIDVTFPASIHQPSESVSHPLDIAKFRFKFQNSFTALVPLLGHKWGFCGGMSAGVLYRSRRNIAAPPDTSPPSQGSALYRELFNRQVETLSEKVLARMIQFQMSPTHPSDWKPHTVGYRTKENWRESLRPQLRRDLTIVMLILADYNDSPTKNHQVLATGYRWFADTQDLAISVYDCNDADGSAELYFNLQRSDIKARYMDGRGIRGFFWNENTEKASD